MYLSLYSDDEELHGEAEDVSGVKTVPKSQKDECGHVRQRLIAQELQPFEDMSSKRETKQIKSFASLHLDRKKDDNLGTCSQKNIMQRLSLPTW